MKIRFILEELFLLCGLLLIGYSIYFLPINKYYFIDLYSTYTYYQNYLYSFIFILSAAIIFASIRLFYFIRTRQLYQLVNYIVITIIITILIIYFIFPDVIINIYIFTIIILLLYIALRFSIYFKYKKRDFEFNDGGYNNPITSFGQDSLNRKQIAIRVSNIIKHTKSNIRISISGRWGVGKTSLMHLIRKKMDSNYIVAWFNPWVYKNQNDLWLGFRKVFEESLITHNNSIIGSLIFSNFKNIVLNIIRKNDKNTLISKMIEELLLNAGTPLEEEIKKRINRYLDERLPKDTKVIFFIDDIDRIDDGKQILEILKSIKEILNFNRITYIISIDDESVSKLISKEFNTTDDGRFFLEKIIDYTIFLEDIHEEEKENYIKFEISKFSGITNPEIVNKINKYLPKNPRTLKRYFNNLYVLQPILKRFSEDEINFSFLYLAQLLKFEFPNIFREIMRTNTNLEIFTTSHRVTRKIGASNKSDEKLFEEDFNKIYPHKLPIPEQDLSRLKTLIRGLQDQASYKDKDILFNFRVLEKNGLMTWKEYLEWFEKINTSVNVYTELLPSENRTEYINQMLGYRNGLMNQIVDSIYEETMYELKPMVFKIDSQIDQLIDLNIEETQIIFQGLYTQAGYWSNFQTHFYKDMRENEKRLILKIATFISEDDPFKLFDFIIPWDIEGHFDEKRNFTAIKLEVLNIIESKIATKLLEKFLVPEGLYLWGHDRYHNEKWYLFQGSVFHSKEHYNELNKLAEQARDNKVIRDNFYQYFSLLNYFITEGHTIVPRQKVIELLRNKDFINILWKAVVSKPVNIRGFIKLLEFIESTKVANDGESKGFFEFPDWWERISKEYESLQETKN